MPTTIVRNELRAAMDTGAVIVVDALPAAPYAARHLPGSVNVVAEDSDEKVRECLPDPQATIVTYSSDGNCVRGPELAQRLEALGYHDVHLYADGIADWVAAGLPVDGGVMSVRPTSKPYLKPPWVARTVGSRMARLFRPAVVQVLSVPGRTSRRWHSVAVAVLDHDGERYVLSAYGDTEWSRNLRSAGHGRLVARGRTETIRVVEVPVAERAPLIAEYRRRFGSFPTVERSFAALPDPVDHPTFRLLVDEVE